MGQTLVIGDVHGCVLELRELLDACAYASGDQVVMVGDLVAKGPDSRGVLRLLRQLRARSVRGNHDQAVLRWHAALQSGNAPASASHHLRIARELDADDWAQLLALPLVMRLPEHEAIVVHGGLVPGLPLEAQPADLLMNMRTLRPDGTGSRRAEDGVLWASRWLGPELVLFGHHAIAGLQQHPYAVGLDTGCVYGGRLSAYLLPQGRVVSVPARAVYAPIEGSAPKGAS